MSENGFYSLYQLFKKVDQEIGAQCSICGASIILVGTTLKCSNQDCESAPVDLGFRFFDRIVF
jgi:hypothetical protein